MNEFSKFHPAVNFIYFLAVLVFSFVFMHPVTLIISLICGIIYSVILNGKKAISLYILPLLILTALLNPIFNHNGKTLLFYLPGTNPVTAEALIFGIASAIMLGSVICHFSCFNKIITSDKFMYLFAKTIPSLSLVFSMALRFVPNFKAQLRTLLNAQKGIGKDLSKGNIILRTKNAVKILSVMITQSLENAIDTADSMKSRGYGIFKRTSYSNQKLDIRDIKSILYILFLSLYIIIGASLGVLDFEYFPCIAGTENTIYSISIYLAYLMLFTYPIIIEIREAIKWKKLKSKI